MALGVGRPRAGTALVHWLFAPAYLAAVCAALVFRPELERARVAYGFTLDVVSLSLFALLGWVALTEALWPWQTAWTYRLTSSLTGWLRLGRDLVYLFFISQLSTLLITLFTPHFTTQPWAPWPTQAPLPVRVLLAFFAVELCSYAFHRAAHAVPVLWRFHATHHVVTELTALKALRTHPLDNVFFAIVRALPIVVLGAGAEELAAATFAGAALGLLAHANVDAAAGPLAWVVNVPRYHAVHHQADVTQGTHNFGCHTVLWDRLFGTFKPGDAQPLQVGVVPVGRRSLWQELLGPFLPSVLAPPSTREPS